MAKISVLGPEEAGKKAKKAVAQWIADEKRKKAEREAAERKAREQAERGRAQATGRTRRAELARHKPEPEGLAKPGQPAPAKPGTEFDMGKEVESLTIRKHRAVRGALTDEERNRLDWGLVSEISNRSLLSVVERLLEDGADPDAKDFEGNPVILIASWKGQTGIVDLLKRYGADAKVLDKDGLGVVVKEPGTLLAGHKDVVK